MEPGPGVLEQEGFSTRDFRNTLGAFPTGVTVITTHGSEHPYGMTANAFSAVSLDPPLVLICVIRDSEGSAHIERNGVFAVNILCRDQEPVSRYFASRDRPRGPEMFSQISHRVGTSGCPILDGAAASLDCRVAEQHVVGDHIVFIGEVLAIGSAPELKPLLFHQGKYAYLSDQ